MDTSRRVPERKVGCRSSSAEAFADYLNRRLQEGCRNGTQLWRELRQLGFGGQQSILRRWLRLQRGQRWNPAIPKPPIPPCSPRHTAWLMLTSPPTAERYLAELYRRSPPNPGARRRGPGVLPNRPPARRRSLATLASLRQRHGARQLLQPSAARPGRRARRPRTPLEQRPVEGHAHRLKLIKRQMYLRGSFDLLRIRVLHAT
jgi:transposase